MPDWLFRFILNAVMVIAILLGAIFVPKLWDAHSGWSIVVFIICTVVSVGCKTLVDEEVIDIAGI